MTGQTPFISPAHMDHSLTQLNGWLVNQAIHVPTGWVEACVSWLVDEHGGMDACGHLSQDEWCQLVYEQWLHSDLRELSCPVLPLSTADATRVGGGDRFRSSGATTTANMKLEGELCLQIMGLYNVGESYYSQLRQQEGNISVNLPYLDNLEADLGQDPDQTHMTQAVSQIVGGGTQRSGTQARFNQPGTPKSLALFLTDGVSQIKAVEMGSIGCRSGQRMLSSTELAERLRPGVKVRLRGPLLLRNKVLLLPAGALQTLSNPQLQVLGGEVDEILENQDGNLMYQLGLLLAKKLHLTIGEDGTLPSWFPRTSMTIRPSEQSDVTETSTTAINSSVPDNARLGTGIAQRPPNASSSPAMEPWDDDALDDAILNEASQSMEQNMTNHSSEQIIPPVASTSMSTPLRYANRSNISKQSEETDISLEDEVDPDVFAEAINELDNVMMSKPKASALATTSEKYQDQQPRISHETIGYTSSPTGNVEMQMKPHQQAKHKPDLSLSANDANDLLPPAPKRKPWERKPLTTTRKQLPGPSSASTTVELETKHTTTTEFKFHPFCYIEDMYNELIQADSNASVPPRRVYTIRGLLISLLSALEHHQGTRWTLAARLADGSATVDVDISSDLLTEWIGLTAAESESLRQMSRALTTGSGSNANAVAIQEAQKHRQRLRSALFNFQSRLSNLTGLFDLTPPPLAFTSLGKTDADSTENDKPLRPILVAFRELDATWLRQLHDRVASRGMLEKQSV